LTETATLIFRLIGQYFRLGYAGL